MFSDLRLVHHVEVAVVVVPDVLLVEPRDIGGAALLRFGVPHVPVGDQLHAVRVGVHRQDDHVAEDAHRLLIGLAGELVDGLDELLGAEHLGGVQAAVDPDHGLAFLRQRARLLVGQALGLGQPARDLAVAVQLLEVLGRRDDRHQLVAALGGLADALDDHPVGLRIELAHVLGELRVVRQHVVGANLVAEELLGCGDPERRNGGGSRGGGGLRARRLDGHQQGEGDECERSDGGVHGKRPQARHCSAESTRSSPAAKAGLARETAGVRRPPVAVRPSRPRAPAGNDEAGSRDRLVRSRHMTLVIPAARACRYIQGLEGGPTCGTYRNRSAAL